MDSAFSLQRVLGSRTGSHTGLLSVRIWVAFGRYDCYSPGSLLMSLQSLAYGFPYGNSGSYSMGTVLL